MGKRLRFFGGENGENQETLDFMLFHGDKSLGEGFLGARHPVSLRRGATSVGSCGGKKTPHAAMTLVQKAQNH